MLGGSFWVAVLRNAMSMGLMMSFFLMLDRPRYVMKKPSDIMWFSGVLQSQVTVSGILLLQRVL